MIGIIAGWLVKRSLAKGGGLTDAHARRIAKVGVVGLAVLASIAAIAVIDWLNDRAAVARHEQARVEQALESERRANDLAEQRRIAREAESRATKDRLEDIHAQDPEAAAAPASAGARAVADRLRPR